LDRGLNGGELLVLIAYAFGMAAGQVLFKTAALQMPETGTLANRVFALALNPSFLLAILLYGVLSALWVWILTTVPLSRAYPFVALAFVLTLSAGVLFFGEALNIRLLLGSALVLAGLMVIVT